MLYNEIERCEKCKDAQLLREVEIGLPHELDDEQRERLVKDFVREQCGRKGMLADVSIHAPDRDSDERNHHAHILLTMRELGPDGFGEKVREWNSKQQLENWREAWECTANRYLEKHGLEARIDRRSLEAQGIDREPALHRGPGADAMERDGIATARRAEWRETRERNATRDELRTLEAEIRVAELEVYLDTVDRDRAAWDDALHAAAIENEKAKPRLAEFKRDESELTRDADSASRSPAGFELEVAVNAAERIVDKVFDLAASGVEAALDGAASVIEGLFETAPSQAPKPRQGSRRKPEQKPDLRRYLDDDYRRALGQREIEERQRREREYHEKWRERER